MQRRRGAGEQGAKATSNTKKRQQPFTGDSPHSPHCIDEADETLTARGVINAADDDVFMDNSWTLQDEAESSMRKRLMWQLLSQRSSTPATIILVAAGPFFSVLAPQLPQGLITGDNHPHQEWLPQTAKEKRNQGRVQDIWPGRHKWRPLVRRTHIHILAGQVDKGAIPELDMSSNYIGLYKTHDDTFQIMLTPKPKRPAPRKKTTTNNIKLI